MPARAWRDRVDDIAEAIDRIARYVEGYDQAKFESDQRTSDAVVRNLEIIGEAVRHLPTHVTARHPEVPWTDIGAMRNILAHAYFGVDVRIVWKTVTIDLPSLRKTLEAIRSWPD